jgi:hypothetical protein
MEYESEFSFGGTKVFVSKCMVEGIQCFFLEPRNGMFDVGSVYGRNDDGVRFDFFCKVRGKHVVSLSFFASLLSCLSSYLQPLVTTCIHIFILHLLPLPLRSLSRFPVSYSATVLVLFFALAYSLHTLSSSSNPPFISFSFFPSTPFLPSSLTNFYCIRIIQIPILSPSSVSLYLHPFVP